MTSPERLQRAVGDPRLVVEAGDLLARFNDAGVLDPVDVHAAGTIGRLLGEADERTLLAAALTVRGTRFGHVCIRVDGIRGDVVVDGRDPEPVDRLPWPEPEAWAAAVLASPLAGGETGDRPLVVEGGRLYLQRYHRYETQVAGAILERIAAEPTPVNSAVVAVLHRFLDTDRRPTLQFAAAHLALTRRFAVIAGGPGTGKTFTVGALLAALAHGDDMPRVAVCAPTGKAAARLGEALAAWAGRVDDGTARERLAAIEPGTIHRLLGWTPVRGRFAHDRDNPLPHDLVVVDETSMVSLPLAAKLLDAVRADASVVFVGDPYQLESIEAGTVLADIVGPRVDPSAPSAARIADHVVVLERGHRFAEEGPIAEVADAIRRGDEAAVLATLQSGEGAVQWLEGRGDTGFAELWQELVDARAETVRCALDGDAAGALAALRRFAVLCAHRDGPDGVGRWSRELETALDERFPGLRWGRLWYPGRPVMITRNDYDLELYNGDIGVCVDSPGGLQVVFERDGMRAVPPSHLAEHTTVHATTIHKAQGSQFDQVVVVLPGEQSRLLTRQLLYTAVTRAEQRVVVLGTAAVVRHAVGRSVSRASGLEERLWEG